MTYETSTGPVDISQEVMRAHQRIRRHLSPTPMKYSEPLSEPGGVNVYLKLENLQPTGSFKVRGAFNRLLALSEEGRTAGVVAASSGNHGLAVAYAAAELGFECVVFVPQGTSTAKTDSIRGLGGQVRRLGSDVAETEAYARRFAEKQGMEYVSPYNDRQVIGGQGTIGLEMCLQLPRIDTIYVAVGGGGLVSGIAGYCKSVLEGVTVVGCLPQNSPVMAESVRAGGIIDMPSLPTLSDGTAGGIEPGALTFDLCRQLVDEFVLVTEGEIVESLRFFIDSHRMTIEGSAALPVAAYLKAEGRLKRHNLALVICGANIHPQTLDEVMSP